MADSILCPSLFTEYTCFFIHIIGQARSIKKPWVSCGEPKPQFLLRYTWQEFRYELPEKLLENIQWEIDCFRWIFQKFAQITWKIWYLRQKYLRDNLFIMNFPITICEVCQWKQFSRSKSEKVVKGLYWKIDNGKMEKINLYY